MSNYKTKQTQKTFSEDNNSTYGFFKRFFIQLHDIHNTGLNFITIWFQFCEVNNLTPKKPWQISNNELMGFDSLTDHEIFLSLAYAIGNFWKAGYTGDGF